MNPRARQNQWLNECQLWLRLVNVGDGEAIEVERRSLRQEAHELKLILTSIIKKLE